jgi:hypothetical protein|tara:strand:+ start:1356 stop:1676 length:321 start_codon:yes stop_codon:yes gene_type:complete
LISSPVLEFLARHGLETHGFLEVIYYRINLNVDTVSKGGTQNSRFSVEKDPRPRQPQSGILAVDVFAEDAAPRCFGQGFELVAIAGDAWLLTRQMSAITWTPWCGT